MNRFAASAVSFAAVAVATACSATTSASSTAGNEDMWGLLIDGQATQLNHAGRAASACAPQDNGGLGMVWTRYSLTQSPDGTVTVVLNGDGTVHSVAARVNTGGTGETVWASYDYGPSSRAGTSAAVVHHDGSRYHISGTLQGGPSPVGGQAPIQASLHPFDLKIICITTD